MEEGRAGRLWSHTAAVIGVCAVVVFGVTASVAAQTPQNDTQTAETSGQAGVRDLSLEQLLSVEVQSVFGASKFLQKITEAPAAVTIVTAEEIERYGWQTLADVLRNVRGFYVTDDRSWAYVGVRGFQRPGDYNTRVLLLLDGHRVNDNVYDQALLQEDSVVDLANVERIEVIRGPSSSLYGSNAFFGVVNVVMRKTLQRDASTVSFDVGTLGLRTGRVQVGRRLPNGLAVSLSATLESMHGVDRLHFVEFDTAASNLGVAIGLDSTRRRNMLAQVSFKGLEVSAGYNHRLRGVPTGAYGMVFNDPNSSVADDTSFLDANWQGWIGSNWQSQLRVGYDWYKYVGIFPYLLNAGEPATTNFDIGSGKWLTSEIQISRVVAGRHHLTLGSVLRQNLDQRMLNYYEGQVAELDVQRRSTVTSAYVQEEWRLHSRLLVNVGARFNHYESFGNPFKPRLAVVYQPGNRTTVKFLYGEAFRAPNLYETDYLAPGYKPNVKLQPEEIRTFEGVVEHYAGKRLRFSGSLFRNSASHLIDFTLDPSDGLNYFANLGSATAVGIETEAEAKWPGGTQARLSYTLTRARSYEVDGAIGDRLTNSPTHLTQALVSAPFVGKTFVGLAVRALSSRYTWDGGQVGGHVVSDVTLSGPLFDNHVRFSLTVANLANQQYADPVATDFTQTAIVQNGRTGHLRLTWRF